jgi:hypothetical protein
MSGERGSRRHGDCDERLYVTESDTGTILHARLEALGKVMYSVM